MNGSLGTLFEVGTAGAGTLDTPLGTRAYADNIRLHFTTALSSLEAAHAMRQELLDYQRSFFLQAPTLAAEEDRRAFVFTSPDRSRLAHFVELLATHRVQTYELAEDVEVAGVRYAAGEAYVVPLAQGQYRMVRGMFDRVREFEEEVFYDVSGWTLPLAYNLEHAALDDGRFGARLLGEPARPAFPEAAPPDEASYGYVFAWTDHYAPRALYRLMEEGLVSRVALQPFTLRSTEGQVELDRGAVFVPIEGQHLGRERIHEIISTVVSREGIQVHGAVSGRTTGAGVDLGAGRSLATLAKPRVLLLFSDGIQDFDAGHVRHLLDARMEIPVTLKQKDRVMEVDWSRYTHLIVPGGIQVGLDPEATTRVRQWVREDGGTVIGLRQGAEWAQEALLDRRAAPGEGLPQDPAARHDFAEMELREAEHAVGGVILASDLDITHPLGFGYHERFLPSHRDTAILLAPPAHPFATVARYRDEGLVLSGYLSEARERQIAGTPMMVAERLGQGGVVLMVDNPNFRGAYLGTNRLLLNSLFFSRLFDTPRDPDRPSYRR